MDKHLQKPLNAQTAPPRTKPSNYPEPFASKMAGRLKRPLGDLFGIEKFGVNLTELPPNSESALLHKHSRQEEFVYILSGHPTLVRENEEVSLSPGMCIGFIPSSSAHKLVNRTREKVVYLEIGDRALDDQVTYPKDDLEARMSAEGKWVFCHKDGKPY